MRLTAVAVLFTCLPACFDFTPTVEADIGGKCGDLDHYCADGLTCDDGVCIREAGSEVGEVCSRTIVCSADLACTFGVCLNTCTSLACGEHGECVTVDGQAECRCDDGYVVDGDFCASDRGTACGELGGQRCANGLACSGGACAEPCNGLLCTGSQLCKRDDVPPSCVCPTGQKLNTLGTQCVSVCIDRACSNHGVCQVVDGRANCTCEAGFHPSDDGTDCERNACIPATHARQACDDGDLYWFDSCDAREEKAAECGARGCAGGACVPISWDERYVSRDSSMPAASIRGGSFDISPSGALEVALLTETKVELHRWTRPGPTVAYVNTDVANPHGAVLRYNDTTGINIAHSAGNRVYFRRYNGGWSGVGNSASDGIQSGVVDDMTLNRDGAPFLIGNGGVGMSLEQGIFFARCDSGSCVTDTSFKGTSIIGIVTVGAVTTDMDGQTPLVGWFSTTGPSDPKTPQLSRKSTSNWVNSSPRAPGSGSKVALSGDGGHTAWVVDQGAEIVARTWVGSGTQPVDTIVATVSASLRRPQLAIDTATGTLIAAWGEDSTSTNAVFARRYDWTGVWSDIVPSSNTGSGLATGAPPSGDIAVRARGGVVCVGWPSQATARYAIRCAVL